MDRHVEFANQLAHLVSLYGRDPVDHAAERSALRAARGAAKHGAIELSLHDDVLRAGLHDVEQPSGEVAAMRALLAALGVTRLTVVHQAKQEEIKRLSKLLAPALAGAASAAACRTELRAGTWKELELEFAPEAAGEPAPADAPADATPAASAATPAAAPADAPAESAPAAVADATAVPPATDHTPADRPPVSDEEGAAPSPSADGSPPVALEEPPGELAPSASDEPTEAAAESETPDHVLSEEEALAAIPAGKPLADRLPEAVEQLVDAEHRELFARLITSSEPLTLRRLLEPVQAAVERTARDGRLTLSARLMQAMLACEGLADDTEMRRQFVVTVRRMTKPTLIRAYAMRYADAPDERGALEAVLARFGEDGAEAVADCVGNAPTREQRALYTALLARLPEANDALLAMLDDERAIVVERAVDLMVDVRHADLERVLGEQLGSDRLRVREAAVRGLSAMPNSEFAADALVRAVQDPAAEIRLVAAIGLHARRDERIVAAVLPLVDAEEEFDVQLALVALLGKIVTVDGVQKLIALANPPERLLKRRNGPLLRLSAIEALGEARTPPAMAALQKLLEDKEKDVREAAARLYSRARRQTAALGVAAVGPT